MKAKYGERLRKIRDEAHLTQAELAEKLDLASSTISKWETNQQPIGKESITRLANFFHVSTDYLLGVADDTGTLPHEEQVDSGATTMPPSNYDPFIDIPVLEFPACAGGGNGYDRSQIYSIAGTFPVEKSALLGHSWQSEGAFVIIVQGDSMLPRISEGDRVVFVRGENVADGDIVIAWWRDRLYVRGFFANANGIELRPLNKRYEPIHIEKGDERLELIGRVVARIPPTEPIGGMAF